MEPTAVVLVAVPIPLLGKLAGDPNVTFGYEDLKDRLPPLLETGLAKIEESKGTWLRRPSSFPARYVGLRIPTDQANRLDALARPLGVRVSAVAGWCLAEASGVALPEVRVAADPIASTPTRATLASLTQRRRSAGSRIVHGEMKEWNRNPRAFKPGVTPSAACSWIKSRLSEREVVHSEFAKLIGAGRGSVTDTLRERRKGAAFIAYMAHWIADNWDQEDLTVPIEEVLTPQK